MPNFELANFFNDFFVFFLWMDVASGVSGPIVWQNAKNMSLQRK